MGRPAKTTDVIRQEKKSHRTKAELKAREAGENELLSSKTLYERAEVKADKTAHTEFLRVSKLMKAIGKNDALYSSALNTYCQLYAEITDLQSQMNELDRTAEALRDAFGRLTDDPAEVPDADQIIRFEQSFTRLVSQRLNIAAMIDKKRKMMLDIDKENVMTIASSLRSIPKKPEKQANPLSALLGDDFNDNESDENV